MDFVSDALANGRRLKSLTADDFTHECVDIPVDHGISGAYVVRTLDQAARFRGYLRAARTDNGPEFTSRAFIAWTQQRGIAHLLIEPGRPMQNGAGQGQVRRTPQARCAQVETGVSLAGDGDRRSNKSSR